MKELTDKQKLDTLSNTELVAYWNIMQFPGLVVGDQNERHTPLVSEILTARGIAHERGRRTEDVVYKATVALYDADDELVIEQGFFGSTPEEANRLAGVGRPKLERTFMDTYGVEGNGFITPAVVSKTTLVPPDFRHPFAEDSEKVTGRKHEQSVN